MIVDQLIAALRAGFNVLVVGVALGAGLPALFALGVKFLAWGVGGDAEDHDPDAPLPPPHPVGRIFAYLLFAIVLGAIGLGISYIVAHGLGYQMVFRGVLPSFVPR